jgi:hypothetical protein
MATEGKRPDAELPEWVRSVVTSIGGVFSSAVFYDVRGRDGPCHPCRAELRPKEPQDALVTEARGLLRFLSLRGPALSEEAEDSRPVNGVSGLTPFGLVAVSA